MKWKGRLDEYTGYLTFFVSLLLSVARTWYFQLPVLLMWVITLLTLVWALVAQRSAMAQVRKRASDDLQDMLVGRDGQAAWGMTEGHWRLTRHLGSVVSIPIPHPEHVHRIIGVLNVDSEMQLAASMLNTDKLLKPIVGRYLPALAQRMVKAGLLKE